MSKDCEVCSQYDTDFVCPKCDMRYCGDCAEDNDHECPYCHPDLIAPGSEK